MFQKSSGASPILKIGFFFDGAFLLSILRYYQTYSEQRLHLKIDQIQNAICRYIADQEERANHYCRATESHLVMGRENADTAEDNDAIYRQRRFDTELEYAGVRAHYLPLVRGSEKGVDVTLALEAYEAALLRSLDVVVLLAGDGDFHPLVGKLVGLGVRVLVPDTDFTYTLHGNPRYIRTARRLIETAIYQPDLDHLIKTYVEEVQSHHSEPQLAKRAGMLTGTICALKDGFGFIRLDRPEFSDDNNVFFHSSALSNTDFNLLNHGDRVNVECSQGERGWSAESVELIPNGLLGANLLHRYN